MDLAALGWSDPLAQAFAPHATAGCVPARVAVEHRSRYELFTSAGPCAAVLAGRLRHDARDRRDLPTVGDWVALQLPGARGPGTVVAVLPRRSVFTRVAAGREGEDQIVAANVDVVFVVSSLNAEFSARRLERYLTLSWESGATPVVVLNKADLAADAEARRREVEAVAVGVPVVLTSATTGAGIQELLEWLTGHRTGALLGSSGVGKSTLVNALIGWERQATGAIRAADDRGRHTTTRRELVPLPGGGLLIDTPGMRELQLTDAAEGLVATFDDVETLAATCAFRDCTHGPEPGCAVRGAVAAGTLAAERLASYHKLQAELAHRERQAGRRKAIESKQAVKAADRALQKHLKNTRG